MNNFITVWKLPGKFIQVTSSSHVFTDFESTNHQSFFIHFCYELEFLNSDKNRQKMPLWLLYKKKKNWSPLIPNIEILWKQNRDFVKTCDEHVKDWTSLDKFKLTAPFLGWPPSWFRILMLFRACSLAAITLFLTPSSVPERKIE